MSLKTLSLSKDLCRCCHAEGSFDDLAQPYAHDGREEVYSDMIKDSFNIEITPVPGQLCVVTYKICKPCILRVRDAFLFKKQVQNCEILFMDLYKRNISENKGLGLKTSIKEELSDSIDGRDDYPLFNDYDIEDDGMKLEDSEDDTIASLKKSKTTKVKSKTTVKAKPKKVKEVKTRKIKEEDVAAEEGEGVTAKKKKGEWKNFKLRPEDYRKKGDIYHCLLCDKICTKRFTDLRDHLKAQHYNLKKFECEFCSEEFKTLARFTSHKLEVHGVDDRFKCNACNKAFNSNTQLCKHMNGYHMMGRKRKCDHCDFESFNTLSLYRHKYKHKSERNHTCRFCKKSFVRSSTLRLHEKIHTGQKTKVCKECGKGFVQKASLNYHMTKYHPEVNF